MKKKYLLATCLLITMVSLTACGEEKQEISTQVQSSVDMNIETPTETENIIVDEDSSFIDVEEYYDSPNEIIESTTENDIEEPIDSETKIEDETLATIFEQVKETLGDDYFPNMPLDADMLESMYGITPDMYESFYAEAPMISAHIDLLFGFKTNESSKDNLLQALNTYVDNLKADTMQYPSNLAKIPAIQIVDNGGDYVFLVATFGNSQYVEENGDEAILAKAQENVQKTIDIINQNI